MMEFIAYLLKMSACSGIFYLFYVFVLRKHVFHQWNRFYLLIAVSVSIAVPLLHFSIQTPAPQAVHTTSQILKVVESVNEFIENPPSGTAENNEYSNFFYVGYLLVSMILFIILLRSLIKISLLIFGSRVQAVDHFYLVYSKSTDTPFSFLNYIFWNENIDQASDNGYRVLVHEMEHVNAKHTLDRLFIRIVLVLFWINPFFWLINRELKLVHEFSADKKAVGDRVDAFAAMILQCVYQGNFNMPASYFFQSSIKRRIQMLTGIRHPKNKNVPRVLGIFVIAVTIMAFTVRTSTISSMRLEKDFTVIIDAGHGKIPNGSFSGAREGNIYEDQIVLELAQKIKTLNQNKHVKILLSRSTDQNVELKDRVEFARKSNADIFLSLHVAANFSGKDAQARSHGIEIIVPGTQPFYQKTSEQLGSILQQELKNAHYTYPNLINPTTGIWVLNKNVCTSVLIECGYITDEVDRAFITNKENQALVAQKILNSIEKFAANSRN